MPKYITRSWWGASLEIEEQSASASTISVHEPEDAPQATGLLDAYGNPLFRVRERASIGFWELSLTEEK